MRSSFAVLALIGAVTQSEVAQAVQKKHHHHHKKHSLAQEPKKDEKEADLNPDDNRKTFDAAVKLASKVVANEVKQENTNVTNVAADNAKATAESNKVFTDVTTARVQQTHGEVNHRQWVNKNQTGNWAQKSTPDASRTTYDEHVKETDKVVAEQQKQEKENVTTITDNHNKSAEKTKTLQDKVTAARVSQIAGEVPQSRDSRGWQLVPPGTGHALAQQKGEEPAKEEKKEEAKAEAPAEAKAEAKAAEPVKEEAKAPAKEEAKAPAKEEAKAEAAPAKEEAKAEAKGDAAPAKAEGGDAKAADGDAKKGLTEEAPKAAAPKAAEADKVAVGTPDVSYSEKAASLKVVLDTVAEQRRFEQGSNADVAAAQEKYYKKSENEKNAVRVARNIQRDGGLVHDSPMPVEYHLPGFTGKASLAQADPAAPVEEKKEAEQAPPKQNPENAYKEKAASRKAVEKAVADQQAFEARSDKDVHAAQEKYWDQSENQKNDVRIDRRIQANGGLDHREGYQRWPASSLMQKKENPDESRKIFEAHVAEAAAVVKTENSIENKRTTQIAKMDAQNIKDTSNESARVRSGRVAMMRGGPKTRYSGGHNGQAAAALAQESGSDASSESDSDEEEVNAKKHQALQQAIAKKQNKQQAKEESSDSSSDSDSD